MAVVLVPADLPVPVVLGLGVLANAGLLGPGRAKAVDTQLGRVVLVPVGPAGLVLFLDGPLRIDFGVLLQSGWLAFVALSRQASRGAYLCASPGSRHSASSRGGG